MIEPNSFPWMRTRTAKYRLASRHFEVKCEARPLQLAWGRRILPALFKCARWGAGCPSRRTPEALRTASATSIELMHPRRHGQGVRPVRTLRTGKGREAPVVSASECSALRVVGPDLCPQPCDLAGFCRMLPAMSTNPDPDGRPDVAREQGDADAFECWWSDTRSRYEFCLPNIA